MARRRTKKRTHVAVNPTKNPGKATSNTGHVNSKEPKSMVIRIGAGEVGSSISQLAKDVRQVLEPGTASRLKERRANRLRDYVTMTGPLGVTHLLLFSRAPSGNTNLRLALAPRGPTLNFRVENYSLCNDIRRSQRHPKGGGKEYVTPPLLLMNHFTTPDASASSPVPKHLESLATTVFQSLIPPINPQKTPLKSVRRVLLLNREPEDGAFVLTFRHYAITTKTAGLSKPLRRLNAAEKFLNTGSMHKGGVPNLGKLGDIADYMVGGEDGAGYMTDGATSGSEMDTDAEVEVLDEVPRRVLSQKYRAASVATTQDRDQDNDSQAGNGDKHEKVEKRVIRLVELGPRMKLRLTKVEEGLCAGKVMWHEHIQKPREEVQELEKRWEQRRREKETRRKEQRENVERKRKDRAASGGKKKGDGEEIAGNDDGDDEVMDFEGNNSDLFEEMMEEEEEDESEDESEDEVMDEE